MKKLITITGLMATLSMRGDNSDCLGNDMTSVSGAGTQAWFGPRQWMVPMRNEPHVKFTPTEAVNTYVVHYGILLDDPSTPGINEAGQLQHITPPVWKTGTTDVIERSEPWVRCGLTGATVGYDLSKYSKVALAVYIYKLGTNTNPIGRAECWLSRGN